MNPDDFDIERDGAPMPSVWRLQSILVALFESLMKHLFDHFKDGGQFRSYAQGVLEGVDLRQEDNQISLTFKTETSLTLNLHVEVVSCAIKMDIGIGVPEVPRISLEDTKAFQKQLASLLAVGKCVEEDYWDMVREIYR